MKIYAKTIEPQVLDQIREVEEKNIFDNDKIKIMPDTHAGKGCVIGFTAPIKEVVVPNLVGVDIGCGILTVYLGDIDINLKELDEFIYHNIPHGKDVNKESNVSALNLTSKLRAKIDVERANKSLGTLGGGNHFIEINRLDSSNGEESIAFPHGLYLQIHTGSRHLGHQICDYYQDLAIKQQMVEIETKKTNLIKTLKELNQVSKIQEELSKLDCTINKSLASLNGELKEDYLHDMKICQEFAWLNREFIAVKILDFLNITPFICDKFHTVHNYIDFDDNILRKGAIACKKNHRVTIGLNMRDGSLLGIGKGNDDWNQSGPHGAGRIMSRTQAKKEISMEDYKKSMEGIYTTSINKSTIDESPFAYKDYQEIMDLVGETVTIVGRIKPVYNFKAGE